MLPDVTALVPLLVSIIGALGIGSLIGQWAAGGKDRRAARAETLRALGAVESARWDAGKPEGHNDLETAVRQLETAALIARVPRRALIPYQQVAFATLWLMRAEHEWREPEEVGLDMEISDLVLEAATIVSRAAWAPSATRWLWLRPRIWRLNRALRNTEDKGFQFQLGSARRNIR